MSAVDFARRALLFMVINALFANELMYVPMVSTEKHIFQREHAANAYSAAAWHLAFLIKMLLSAALKSIFYPWAFYFPAQLQRTWASYFVAAFLTGGMGFAGAPGARVRVRVRAGAKDEGEGEG